MRVICEECNGKGWTSIRPYKEKPSRENATCIIHQLNECNSCQGNGYTEVTIDFSNLRNLVKSLAKASLVGLPDLINELNEYEMLEPIAKATIKAFGCNFIITKGPYYEPDVQLNNKSDLLEWVKGEVE